MPIFYTIYSLSWGQHLGNAQRNCRVFLYGACVYVLIFLLLKNLQIQGYLNQMYDALHSAFIILLMIDIATMGYLYRQYYGRSLVHEVTSTIGDDKEQKWKYDPDTHKYSKVTYEEQMANDLHQKQVEAEYELRQKLLKHELQERETAVLAEKRAHQETEEILEKKRQIHAATIIQKWWRNKLYRPGDGIFYLRAKKQFNTTMKQLN